MTPDAIPVVDVWLIVAVAFVLGAFAGMAGTAAYLTRSDRPEPKTERTPTFTYENVHFCADGSIRPLDPTAPMTITGYQQALP